MQAVQREVTRNITECKDMNYKDRLSYLKLTNLLERRMRGDLIETLRILNNFPDYGHHWFHVSEKTGKLILQDNAHHKRDFFANRVVM